MRIARSRLAAARAGAAAHEQALDAAGVARRVLGVQAPRCCRPARPESRRFALQGSACGKAGAGHSAAKKWAEQAWSPPPVPVMLLRCPARSSPEESARAAPLLGFQAALEVAGLAYSDFAIICDGLGVQR